MSASEKFIGLRIKIHAKEILGETLEALVRAADPKLNVLLLELFPIVEIGRVKYQFAVVKPRLERDDIDSLFNEVVGCTITFVPFERYNPRNPFDLSWWRGGSATIADVSAL